MSARNQTLAYGIVQREAPPAVPKLSSRSGRTISWPRPGAGALGPQPTMPPVLIPIELDAAETLLAPIETLAENSTTSAGLPAVRPEDRYTEVRALGEGAMGEVVLAHDMAIEREVAIKRPHGAAPGGEGQFWHEVRMMGRLEHPNIVPVHDVGTGPDGRPFIVMKRVEGETLAEILERLQARDAEYVLAYSVERLVEIFIGLLRALEYAHDKGVLHRDIKPENVMIGPYGEVVLMDWGIAKPLGDTDRRIVGTPFYMSPEQARGADLDERSDLYSAAVLLHEMLTLRHYLGDVEDVPAVLAAVSQHGWKHSLMDWHRPGLAPMPPMELYHFLRHAMAHDRERRFASAEEMITELHLIHEGRMRIQCHITLVKSTTRRLGRFVDRRPWLAFGLFLVTAGLLVQGIVGTATALFG